MYLPQHYPQAFPNTRLLTRNSLPRSQPACRAAARAPLVRRAPRRLRGLLPRLQDRRGGGRVRGDARPRAVPAAFRRPCKRQVVGRVPRPPAMCLAESTRLARGGCSFGPRAAAKQPSQRYPALRQPRRALLQPTFREQQGCRDGGGWRRGERVGALSQRVRAAAAHGHRGFGDVVVLRGGQAELQGR